VVVREGDNWRTIARSSSENISPDYLAMPEAITWQAEDGSTVFGLYYRPANPNYQSAGLPPAVIHIHGGPTSQATVRYDADISYFTSRGYAWLEVNHRGSTGYGYTYQNKLYHRWGDVDVEDAVSGARTLIDRVLANPKQLIIMGGSAGGYTVLNSLVRYPGVFKAGVSLYGISNLFALDQDTHKFEAFYNASLIGVLPEAAERYHAWSAVFHAERIQDALAIFQGSEDVVVPPSQSEEIVKKLRQRGVPHLYQLYEGEGHGFRKNETLLDFYQRVESFFQQQVLFAP
jgi:dipeptidyl aminopeptidase/acylaminoacyl peptidase